MENVQSVTTQCYTVVDWVTCLQLTLLCTLGHSESSVISYDFQIKLLTWPVMFSYQSGLCVVGCFLAVAGSITTQIQVRGRAFSIIWHHIRRTLCSTQPVQGSGEIDGWAHSFWFLNTSSPISIKKKLKMHIYSFTNPVPCPFEWLFVAAPAENNLRLSMLRPLWFHPYTPNANLFLHPGTENDFSITKCQTQDTTAHMVMNDYDWHTSYANV